MNETAPKKHIHVACALIERDGLVLAAQRSAVMSIPLKWEFPGGKLEAGESAEECLRRELVEEMGVTAFLLKPVSAQELGELMCEALGETGTSPPISH